MQREEGERGGRRMTGQRENMVTRREEGGGVGMMFFFSWHIKNTDRYCEECEGLTAHNPITACSSGTRYCKLQEGWNVRDIWAVQTRRRAVVGAMGCPPTSSPPKNGIFLEGPGLRPDKNWPLQDYPVLSAHCIDLHFKRLR